MTQTQGSLRVRVFWKFYPLCFHFLNALNPEKLHTINFVLKTINIFLLKKKISLL